MMRFFMRRMAVPAVMLAALCGPGMRAEEKEDEETAVALDKLPKAVLEAVKKMFPEAELLEASSEKEHDETYYEVGLKDHGQKIDVTVEEDGEIESVERELALKDLPKPVVEAIAAKYPHSTLKSAETVSEIEDGKEELAFYEVQIETADKKEMEVKIKYELEFVTE